MSVILEQHEELEAIRLEGAVGIASAAELKALLVDALSSGRALRIYLNQATELDVCILQLLIAAARAWRLATRSLTFAGPLLQPVSTLIADAGLDAIELDSRDALHSTAAILNEV